MVEDLHGRWGYFTTIDPAAKNLKKALIFTDDFVYSTHRKKKYFFLG
jgi:hypothetical protein